METPVRVAFCPIYFASNGGRFDDLGQPIFASHDDLEGVRGNCDIAHDCGQCPLLRDWVYDLVPQGWQVGWECGLCLKQTKGDGRVLPGYYQSGWSHDEDRPALDGCTRCGWESNFLQLVLRRSG